MTTTLTINNAPVTVEFENRFGRVLITAMSDEDNNAVCPDLLGEVEIDELERQLYIEWLDKYGKVA